jgi:soluble lytic murein transglycosylase-like protein
MTHRARVRPGLVRAVTLILGAMLCAAGPAHAQVRQRDLDGDLVFTLRPRQKPSDAPGSGRVTPPSRGASREIDGLVREISRRYDMDPGLIATVVGVESGFNRMAVSPKGARGLMQLMPETARQYGVRDVHDPRENLEGGVAYLSDLVRRYNGDMKLALAAYNAGPEAVARASGVPNFRETRDYLQRIEARYGQKLAFTVMKPGGTARPARSNILTVRDEHGTLMATNRRGMGATIVPNKRKPVMARP